MITILLADDHRIFREGLQSLFAQTTDFQVIATADNGLEAVAQAEQHRPDIIIMDVSMPELNGIEATRRILHGFPQAKVIGLSMHPERNFVMEMLKAGGVGYLLKDEPFEDLLNAIKLVAKGGTYLPPRLSNLLIHDLHEEPQKRLSRREIEVLQLLASGQSTKQAADALFVSSKTIETHRSNIMKKLELHNLADLTRYAIRNGLVGS